MSRFYCPYLFTLSSSCTLSNILQGRGLVHLFPPCLQVAAEVAYGPTGVTVTTQDAVYQGVCGGDDERGQGKKDWAEEKKAGLGVGVGGWRG